MQKVYVIREFSNDTYKGHHIAVADDMLVAQIFAQRYVKEHYGDQAVWQTEEWQDHAEGETFRFFTANHHGYEMIVQENNLINAETVSWM